MAKWYYSQNDEKHGPVTGEQLKELADTGHIQPTDMIWKEGMENWVKASGVKGLFPIATEMPTAIPPLIQPELQSQSPVSSEPVPGELSSKRNHMANWYYTQKNNRHGPVSGEQLKGLAEAGQIQPTDMIWKKGMEQWQKASNVKGLLPLTPKVMATPVPPPSRFESQSQPQASTEAIQEQLSQKEKILRHPAVIATSLLFLPVALFLIWRHPVWEKKIKVFCTLGSIVIFVVLGITGEPPSGPTDTSGRSASLEEIITFGDYTYTVQQGNVEITGVKDKSILELSIPNTIDHKPVTGIGKKAFEHCDNLNSVTIPDSVTHIGDSAFWGCHKLGTVTIPDSVESIGRGTFSFCNILRSIDVTSGNNCYVSVDGILYSKDMKTLLVCPAQKDVVSINIPTSVTDI